MNSRLHSRRSPLFDPSPYIPTSLPPYLPLDRHRDQNRVTVTPLEPALTKRDACKSFRIRSYKNCRVSPGSAAIAATSRRHPCEFAPLFSVTSTMLFPEPFSFQTLASLPGGVPPSSVPTSPSGFHHFLLFHIRAHSFALTQNSTHFFSSDSALFAQNTRGVHPHSSHSGTQRLS